MIKFLIIVGVLLLFLTALFVTYPNSQQLKSADENGITVRRASASQKPTNEAPEEGEWIVRLPRPLATPPPCSTCTQPYNRGESVFLWKWPHKLQTQDEGTVTLSILTTGDTDFSVQDALPDERSGTERPNLGLPKLVPLAHAFGPGYRAVAKASLEAPSFNRTPPEAVERVLDESEAKWQWIVTPQTEGNKILTVNLRVDWTGTDKRHSPKSREWSKSLKCDATKPVVVLGTFEFLPWVTGISGATLLAFAGIIFGKRKLQGQ